MAYPEFFPQARANLAIAPAGSVPIEGAGLIRLGAVPPRRIRYESNDIFTADTFDVEIDETLFPLDPRDVLAVSVDLHLGDAGGFGRWIDTQGNRNRLILGQADELRKSIQTDTASTVSITGRDYAGMLLDEKWQTRRVDLGRSLSEIVEEVVDSIPAIRRMRVRLLEESFDPVIPGGKGRKRATYSGQADQSVWEVLVGLGLKVGAIVTVDRDDLVIQPPRNALSVAESSRSPLFVEGRNLRDLEIGRTLGKPDVPNVLVQSLDPDTGAVVEGRYPRNWKEVARATRVGEKAEKTVNVEFRRFVVRHPKPTIRALEAVARQVYDFHAREQVEISFKTLDMVVSSSPLPPDIGRRFSVDSDPGTVRTTQLRNGSPLRIRVEPDARNVLERAISEEDKERELREIGYQAEVAAILARGFRLFDELFFVSTAAHDYDTEKGYSLDVKALNFIQVDA